MGRLCTVCTHPRRDEIEAAIIEGRSYRVIAEEFGLKKDAVRRHALNHLRKDLIEKAAEVEARYADDLLHRLLGYLTDAEDLLERAEEAGDLRTALNGVKEARASLELLARLRGELEAQGKVAVNVLSLPVWREAQTIIYYVSLYR